MKVLHTTLLIVALASQAVIAQRNIMIPLSSRILPLLPRCVGWNQKYNGAPVVIYDCSDSALMLTFPANPMYVDQPSGQIKAGGPDSIFCLDAQNDHPEGDGWLGLTIYECDSAYNISSQQRWTIYINEIRRIPEVIISLSDRSRCIDVKNSDTTIGTQIGTFPCDKHYNSRNQLFSYVGSNYEFKLDM